jgi:hypothetical protein
MRNGRGKPRKLALKRLLKKSSATANGDLSG